MGSYLSRLKNRFESVSIRTRIVSMVVLISLLAGTILGTALISLSRNTLRNEVLSANQTSAEITAEFAANYIAAVQAHVLVFASRPDVVGAILGGTPAQLQPTLAAFIQVQTALDSVAIFTPDGTQVASDQLNAATIGQSFTDRDWYQEVIKTKQPVLSVPVVSRMTGHFIIPFCVPVLDEQQELQGILNGIISISRLSAAIGSIETSRDTHISIIDLRDNGIVIADTNNAHLLTPISHPYDEVYELLVAGYQDSIITDDPAAPKELVGLSPVSGLPWGVIVSIPFGVAMANVTTLTNTAILLTIIVVLLAIVLGIVLSFSVVKPLRLLSEGTRIIGQGNLDYPIAISAKDEVGSLSQSIASMAQNLKTTLVSRDKLALEVSERKKSEDALKTSEIRYRRLFEAAQDGILILDAKTGIILDVNPYLADLLDYAVEDLLGKYVWDISSFDDIIENEAKFATVQKEHFIRYDDMPIETSTGRMIDVEFVSNVYQAGSESVIQCNIRDISSRVKAETENRLLRDKAEISSRLATVGEMAAGIAHEINNPLTGVIGFSELMGERNDLPDDVIENLAIIHKGSIRVKEIVKRMLTFARQNKPAKTTVNLHELIENTLEMRGYVLRTANIKVVKDFDAELPLTDADPGQMQQVFLNIIVNAEYAMKKANDRGTLTITSRATDNEIRLSFTDDGPGITEDVQAKLFQPFLTTKSPGEGTGLGLSLSRAIILEHNGTLEFESQAGVGTTFTITLPVVSGMKSTSTTPEQIVPAKVSTPARILVVDDEPTIRALIKSISSSRGHTVETTDNPHHALELLSESVFDLIFLDIRMPGMSGMELHREISSRWPTLAKRVVFITGDTSDLVIREYLSNNNIPYISKPFDRSTLETVTNSMLVKNETESA